MYINFQDSSPPLSPQLTHTLFNFQVRLSMQFSDCFFHFVLHSGFAQVALPKLVCEMLWNLNQHFISIHCTLLCSISLNSIMLIPPQPPHSISSICIFHFLKNFKFSHHIWSSTSTPEWTRICYVTFTKIFSIPNSSNSSTFRVCVMRETKHTQHAKQFKTRMNLIFSPSNQPFLTFPFIITFWTIKTEKFIWVWDENWKLKLVLFLLLFFSQTDSI